MILKTQEVLGTKRNHKNINKALQKKELYKVSHGLYSLKPIAVVEMELIFMRFPKAILTLESAFAYYEMIDYIPIKYVVATGQKSHKIPLYNKIDQIYMSDNLLDIGKETINTKYGIINIYNKERLLIELFRFKRRISHSVFKEVVQAYRKLVENEELDIGKLLDYCSYFRSCETIKMNIQEIIL